MKKRLFFGVKAHAIWPEKPLHAHLTLDFLGNAEVPDLTNFPQPKIALGVAGIADELLHLRHVIAYHIDFFQEISRLTTLRDTQSFLPHVTITRDKTKKIDFHPFPIVTSALHLYESLGNSQYKSLWNLPLLPPIEEFSHTADLAFFIRAETLQELYRNAQLALCLHHPEMLPEFRPDETVNTFDEIIFALNDFITRVDTTIGAPYKAVSFHGKLIEKEFLTWEMIVDV